jgi:hypothetical protein
VKRCDLYSFGAERSPSMRQHIGDMERMPTSCEHYKCACVYCSPLPFMHRATCIHDKPEGC